MTLSRKAKWFGVIAAATFTASTGCGEVEGGATDGCSASTIDGCEYAGRNLTVTERVGVTSSNSTTGRSLPLRIEIPEGAGPFPVVIWSHGGGFNDTGHLLGKEWGDALSSHGFVVVHPGHVTPTKNELAALCTWAGIPVAECNGDDQSEDFPFLAAVRSHDIITVMDDLSRLSGLSVGQGGPALDLTRVVIGGWSGGSRSSMVLMGAKIDITTTVSRFSRPDARPVASIVLSATGPGFGGFFDTGSETSWDAMRGPVFMATGDNDVKPTNPELTGPVRRVPFSAQPGDGGARHLLYSKLAVGIGGHSSFNLEDLDSSDERLTRLSRSLRSSVFAFLDAEVRGDAAAAKWIGSTNAAVLAGEVEWLTR